MNKKPSKKWISFDIKVDEAKNDTKVTTSSSLKHCSSSIETKLSYNFFEKVTPTDESHLAVHPKKIKQVEEWLLQNVKDRTAKQMTSILLITGPTGSGKTTTVTVLCKKLDIKITEWVNPVDQDYEFAKGSGQSARFLEFLVQSKYSSLHEEEDSGQKLILVEDFPNSLIRKPDEFFTILEKAYYKARSAMVFICADEDKTINISHQLFPQNIRDLYRVQNITFNACSATLVKSCLKRALCIIQGKLDLFSLPSTDVIEAIVVTSCGDLRCALNQFYFASLKTSSKLEMEMYKKSGTKRKRTTKSNAKLKNMCKDESLTLFHGVGRILNPKRIDRGDGSWRLDVNLDSVITTFSSNPRRCISFLHENYFKYYGDIEDVYKAADVLSFSQTLFDHWSEEFDIIRTYGLYVAILGLMVHNEHNISRWNQITGPRRIENIIERRLEGGEVEYLDGIYYNLILKTQNYTVLKNWVAVI